MHPEPLEFAPRRRVAWLGLLGSLAFVALGLWLMLVPGLPAKGRWIGGANVAFFGLCALVYGAEARRSPVALRLDASGIEYRHPDPRQAFHVGWRSVASVRTRDEERASLVTLTLKNPEGLPAQLAPDWALARGAWPPLIPPETILSPTALGTTATELAEAIERFRRYYDPSPAP